MTETTCPSHEAVALILTAAERASIKAAIILREMAAEEVNSTTSCWSPDCPDCAFDASERAAGVAWLPGDTSQYEPAGPAYDDVIAEWRRARAAA